VRKRGPAPGEKKLSRKTIKKKQEKDKDKDKNAIKSLTAVKPKAAT